MFEREIVRNRSGEVLVNGRVELETAVFRELITEIDLMSSRVELGLDSEEWERGVPNNPISFLEPCNSLTDFIDFACYIGTQDVRIVGNHEPVVLDFPINGIDSNSDILDNDLARPRFLIWRRVDL